MLAQKNGLSGTALKTIALVLMLLDHIHYFFAFTGAVPTLFSMLGRLSAPLFLFCTVEGFAHTRDRKRYFLRIWAIGAGMAAVQFFMMYGGMLRRGDGFYPQNGIFQSLSLLCVLWQGMDWLRARRFLPGAAAILGVLLWPFVAAGLLMAFPQISQHPAASSAAAFLITSPLPMWSGITDGGWSFLLGGVLLYLLRSRRTLQVAVWALNSLMCRVLPAGGGGVGDLLAGADLGGVRPSGQRSGSGLHPGDAAGVRPDRPAGGGGGAGPAVPVCRVCRAGQPPAPGHQYGPEAPAEGHGILAGPALAPVGVRPVLSAGGAGRGRGVLVPV